MGRAFEHQQTVVHAGGLDHAAVLGDVPAQNCQAAFLAEGMLKRADTTFSAVGVQAGPAGGLAEGHLCGDPGGASHVESLDRLGWIAGDVPLVQRVFHGFGVHGGHIGVQLACAVELTQDGHDAASAVDVFDVVLVGIGCHFAQLGHDFGHAVDVGHGELDLGLLCNG